MNTPARKTFLGALVAIFFALTFAALAQDKPAPTAAPDQPAPAAAPAKPADEKPALRRLDTAPSDSAAKHDDDDDHDNKASGDDDDDDKKTPASQEKSHHKYHSYGYIKGQRSGDARVTIGGSSHLAKGETADAVVSIFGSSTNEGTTSDAVVSILGNSTSSGEVGSAVVSILGNTRVTGGNVGEASVAVVGNNYVDAHVHDAVVAVLGDVELGPNAEVDGDIVSVGGVVKKDPHAITHGHVQNVGVGEHFGGVRGAEGLRAWFTQCVLFARPLAFGPHLCWAWCIALIFLAIYALIALIFHRGVEKCCETFEQRPGFSMLAALLTVLLTPVVIVLLCITVIGIVLIPFIAAGLFFASLFGKAVMLAWIGRRVLALTGGARSGPAIALAVLIGGAIALLLYTVPVLGFIVYKLLGVLGLGVVVYTLLLANKRKSAPPVPPAPPPAPPPVAPTAVPLGVVETTTAAPGEPAAVAAAPVLPVPVAPPPLVSAATLTRAGFWIRLVASAVDAVVVGLALGLVPHAVRPHFLLLYAAYCVVLWAMKGTTVGGIVCSLKVVRLDDRPIDWMTALVRALSGFLSLFVAGIGFIWVVFDDHGQSWHDKIAGTTVVVVPKGVSLV